MLVNIFSCDFIHFNFFKKIIQKSDLLLSPYASLYLSFHSMLSKIRENSDELEQAKITLPNCKCRTLPQVDKD